MVSDLYECSTCGKEFEFRRTRDYHEKREHESKLTSFDDSGELKRLDSMSEALRNNDYNSQSESSAKTTQKTLKGGELTNGRCR